MSNKLGLLTMSSKIKYIYILIGILLLLVSLKSGFALQEDFNAYSSQKDIYACSCSVTLNRIILENTGDVTSVYDIKQEGSAAAYSSIAENGFSLEPGETKGASNFISIPCGITGEFRIKTEISTIFGLKKEMEQKVIAKDCVDINLMMVEASVPVCPCSPARYIFTVENTGTFLETYKLAIDSDYAELSEDILVLGSKQRGNVTVFITTPCGSYGDLNFELDALAERSGMLAQLPFVLHVNPCYEYVISGLNQYSVCSGLNNIIPIKINNTAKVANTYFLGSDADWANFEEPMIDLWGGQSKVVNLDVYPVDVATNNYNITLSGITARGEIKKTLNIATNVENCYSLNLSSDYVYAQLVEGEKGTLIARLKNDGTRASNYSLTLVGPEWFSIDSNLASLNPGMVKDVKINYNVVANATGQESLMLYAALVDYPERINSIQTNFDIFKIEDAYKIEIDADDNDLDTNYDGKTAPITITNNGIRDGNYTLSMSSGDSWIKLDRNKVEVPQGTSQNVGLVLTPVNGTPEGIYFVTIDALLDNTNVAYSRTFEVILREKTMMEKISSFMSSYWMYISGGLLGLLLLILLLILLVRYRKKHPRAPKAPKEEKKEVKEEPLIKKEKKGRKWLKWLLLILLLLLLLGGIGFAGWKWVYTPYLTNVTWSNITQMIYTPSVEPAPEPPKEPEPVEPVTEATIFVNRTGLKGYGNIIEVIGLENITIPLIIQNSDQPNTYIIRVSEEIDWVTTDKRNMNIPPGGRETVNIYVTPTPEVEEGSYNLTVAINIAGREKPISEEIVLEVREKRPFYVEYMWYLIGGALALVLLLVILRLKDRKKEKYGEYDGGLETVGKEPKEGKAKGILVVILLILVILSLIAGLVYLGLNVIPPMIKGTNETISQANETAQPEAPEEAYENVFIRKGTENLIPITISNVNKTTTFRITVKKDVDWLNVDNEFVSIGPGENKTINLIASPNMTVENGDYKVTVYINIAQGEKVFSRNFVLNVRKSRFSDVLSYFYYILAGALVLLILVKLLGRKKKPYEDESEEVSEEKPKRKKTGFRLE